MQAIQLNKPGGLDNLAAVDLDTRDPGPGEIRVRNHASSLNFHDYAVVVGLISVEDKRIPMSDGAGVVEAVGEGVTGFAEGDHVMSVFFPNWESGDPQRDWMSDVPGDMADGFAAESVTRPARCFTRIPAGYSFEQAATLPCAALTAWRALMVEARIKPGDTVLVQGSGGVSVFALQFAKAAGCRVIATSSTDEKLARLASLGADLLVNYRTHEAWGDEVLKLTGGEGADVVVEVGGSGTLAQSVRAAAFGGHISMIGVLTGISGEVPTAELFQKNAVISGITVGSRSEQVDMVEAIEANGIEPVISDTFELTGIADAFRLQEAHGHFGKICLSF
jgi:NADPH:quinone reductase-like Zn-dependent oxidoreductase